MSIAVDASTPAPTATSSVIASGGTIASAAITAPANSLIVICLAVQGTTNVAGHPDACITGVSGGGLTFTELAYAYHGSDSYASIWVGYGSPSASSTFTAQFGTGYGSLATYGATLIPIVLTGAASTQNGGVATDLSGSTGAGSGTGGAALESASATPSVTVNATASGSLILAVQSNDTSATSPTVPGSQTITFNGHSSFYGSTGDNGLWAQMQTALTSGAGNVTINDTAPTGLMMAMCGAEILASAGGGGAAPLWTPQYGPAM